MPPLKAQLLLEESLSAYFPEMVFTDSGITVQLHQNTQERPPLGTAQHGGRAARQPLAAEKPAPARRRAGLSPQLRLAPGPRPAPGVDLVEGVDEGSGESGLSGSDWQFLPLIPNSSPILL